MQEKVFSKRLIILYILLGLLAYLLFFISRMPMNLVVEQLGLRQQPGLPLQIGPISGTIWQGTAELQVPPVGSLQVIWDVHSSALLMGRVAAHIEAKAEGLKLKGDLAYSALGRVHARRVNGFIDAQLINRVIAEQRASTQGGVKIEHLELVVKPQPFAADQAAGLLLWGGGEVGFMAGRQRQTVNMPPMVGRLQQVEQGLQLRVFDKQDTLAGQLSLAENGWAKLEVRPHLLRLAGQRPPAGEADVNVFEVEQKLF